MVYLLKSFYSSVIRKNKPIGSVKILDLGCGDGILTHELLKIDNQIEAILIDGSSEMISNARKRLKKCSNIQYFQKTFQSFLDDKITIDKQDFVVSSLAIHHLTMEGKESLFRYIYDLLDKSGYFINIDVVLSPSNELENWCLQLWKEWITYNDKQIDDGNDYSHIPIKYKEADNNIPDPLMDQIKLLSRVSFKEVDCLYKHGIFAVYSGKK